MHNPAVHTQTPQDQVAAIRAQKKIILGVKSWRAIPEYVAEMGTLSHQERQLKRTLGSEDPSPAPKPAPRGEAPSRKIVTGGRVQHEKFGDGRVTFIELSAKLRAFIVTVKYDSGETHSCFADDLAYIPEGDRP